ncbi:MAG: MBL fold metallo-hydrolase [Magnetospiraceae bacterium]
MTLKATILPVTPLQQNCTLIWSEETMIGAVIDPGGDVPMIQSAIEKIGMTLEKVLVTHGHADHAGGTVTLAEAYGVPIEGPHEDDLFWIEQLAVAGARYGIAGARVFTPDRWLKDGDTVTVGDETLNVIHCPGHTPGHVVFHHAEAGFAQVGDVLFQGSIGRTDFPRGDHATLIASITQKLWPLGDHVTFVPGHGPPSTFGQERQNNPYVSDRALGT